MMPVARSLSGTWGLVISGSLAVLQDFVTPTVDRAGEACELGDLGVGGVLEEHDQAPLRVRKILGCVDLGEQLSGEPHGCDLTIDTGWGKLRYLEQLLSSADLARVQWKNAVAIFPPTAFPSC